jgi:hypothetical protein
VNRRRALAAVALAPLVALALGHTALLAYRAAGYDPWYEPEANVPEAIATRNFGEVVRMIEAGASPDRAAPVRGDFLGRRTDMVLTPLEAAVVVGLPEMFTLAQEYGARPTPQQVHTLKCLAGEPRGEIKELLDRLSPDIPTDCPHIQDR